MTREEIAENILQGNVPERYEMKGFTIKDVVLDPCVGRTKMEGLYIAYRGSTGDTIWRPVLTDEEYEFRHRQLEEAAARFIKAAMACGRKSTKEGGKYHKHESGNHPGLP